MARSKKPDRPDQKYRPKPKSRTLRKGDRMITLTRETQPAVVDYNDILACCEVVVDEDQEAPWENDDGWEHEAKDVRRIEEDQGWGHWEEDRWVNHWNPDHVAHCGNYDRRLIVVSWDQVKEWQGDYGWARGESRQVWQERMAECRRNAIEQLVRWYEKGWTAYGVVCKFLDYQASLWGIFTEDDSDDDPYLDEVKHDVAGEVAAQLEKDGFTVVNEPDWKARRQTREFKQNALRWRIAHNLGFNKPEEYRAWIEARQEELACANEC